MRASIASVVVLLMARTAFPQDSLGVVTGIVLARDTRVPVPRARITLVSDKRLIFADSLGRYRVTGIPAGRTELVAQAIGFVPANVVVTLSAGQNLTWPIFMDSLRVRPTDATPLPSVGVTAQAPGAYRYVAFERRRKTGRGRYLTEDDIISMGAYNVPDAVKNFPGVLYECDSEGCWVRFSRAPARCLPEYIVDDQVMNDFGRWTPIRDIVAMEIYQGPADVPGEYSGSNAGCGVIVIWTRNGPPPKKAP